jgi:tRNA threonylcarbamoyladenosine biosynthesis protein TsaE
MDLIFSLNDIDKTAIQFLSLVDKKKIIAFHGEMGAGKTTFIHAVCEALGVKDAVSSPTFAIINQYQTKKNESIYHIDLYRLKNDEEAVQAGVEDCLYSGNRCFVEWPGKAAGLLPENTLHVHIAPVNNDTRKLTINL